MATKRFADSLQIPFIEEAFSLDDINGADEIFLTSSMSEVLPVTQVDGNKVANGEPGLITRQLQEANNQDAKIVGSKQISDLKNTRLNSSHVAISYTIFR